MKVAASVFALAGFIYLAWDLALIFSVGLKIEAVLMALVAAALLMQSYSLFRLKPRSRLYGLISSAALFICFSVVVAVLVSAAGSLPVSQWPREALTTLSLMIGTATAFVLAFICLLVDKRAA